LKIETSRFGTLEVSEEQVIHVPGGLIGFPEDQRYVVMEHRKDSPFVWFQSLDHAALAFVLMDPFFCNPDYEVDLTPEDAAALKLGDGREAAEGIDPMVIVNVSKGDSKEVTLNLLGPVIFNRPKRLAKQVVLFGSSYSHRHPMALADC
jgi:flagellar assembly factor FliW